MAGARWCNCDGQRRMEFVGTGKKPYNKAVCVVCGEWVFDNIYQEYLKTGIKTPIKPFVKKEVPQMQSIQLDASPARETDNRSERIERLACLKIAAELIKASLTSHPEPQSRTVEDLRNIALDTAYYLSKNLLTKSVSQAQADLDALKILQGQSQDEISF